MTPFRFGTSTECQQKRVDLAWTGSEIAETEHTGIRRGNPYHSKKSGKFTTKGECETMKLKTNRLSRLAGLSTLGIVLLIVVLVILFGGGFGFGWGGPGYYGGGGLVLLIIIILLVLGKL